MAAPQSELQIEDQGVGRDAVPTLEQPRRVLDYTAAGAGNNDALVRRHVEQAQRSGIWLTSHCSVGVR